ncbi:MAG TPA: hypothetical protein VG028_16115 [Terriglobia bacterium]|nr:hypothetical protein [Terriglobia bacterium]
MKSNRGMKMAWLMGVALLMSSLGTSLARAQEYARKFPLPFEVRWGQAALPAGEYSLLLDKMLSDSTVQLSREKKAFGFIKAEAYDLNRSGQNSLILVKTQFGKCVSELRLREIGVVLHYAPGLQRSFKPAERERVAKGFVIPVATMGK